MLLKDLCEEYGESYSTMIKRCLDGSLPAEKINGCWDIKLNDYKAWKKTRRVSVKKKPKDTDEKNNNRQCEKCKYGMLIGSTTYYCNYLEITGRMRNCSTYPVCEKFEPITKRKKRILKLPAKTSITFE